tara:strand:+ start:681 stop:956 length:276 start_codon:yes stop_codon:yes gene_type:complete
MTITCIQLRVTGKVQGVSYRISAKREADKLGLTGWVRNQSDGSVDILIEGYQTELDTFIQWAQNGPQYADVHHVSIKSLTTSPEYNDFNIR